MIRINENFEVNWDGNCWTLYEWYDGFKKVGKEKVPDRKKSDPRYYSDIVPLCKAVINRSAGRACAESQNIIEAVHTAEKSLYRSFRSEFTFLYE